MLLEEKIREPVQKLGLISELLLLLTVDAVVNQKPRVYQLDPIAFGGAAIFPFLEKLKILNSFFLAPRNFVCRRAK